MAEQFVREIEASPLVEQERAELEAAVARLARSPRLCNLLRYVGQKYLHGESDQIREFNIATEVFGRPATFDSTQDAIARVEAHRLRKKLKEYYEAEGKNRSVHISIPLGTYVPRFTHCAEGCEAPQVAEPTPVDPPPLESKKFSAQDVSFPDHAVPGKRVVWLYLAGTLFIFAFVGFGVNSWKHRTKPAPKGADATHQPSAPAVVASAIPQTGAVRLLAGYSGQPHIDATGAVWGPDKYFRSGRPWPRPPGFLARTNDPFLFQNTRTGEFSYDLPLKPGIYELHLYFVESNYGPGLGGGENDRTFSVDINGERLLPGFDIESDALGPNVADERIFKDIQPAKDGKLHIAFEDSRGEPIVSAIEVVPGIPHKQVPIRLVMQPSSFIDHAGQLWRPDNYYLDGQTSVRRPPPAGSSDPELYAMERYGHFTYAIPVDTRGRYTLVLHFVEDYFGPQASGVGGVGSRQFRIMCNGIALADDFDIFKEAGSMHALTKTFRHLKPTAQGKLNLSFEPIANYASVSAIEVLDESE